MNEYEKWAEQQNSDIERRRDQQAMIYSALLVIAIGGMVTICLWLMGVIG